MAISEKHWGRWIVARSRVVGFRSQKNLADAVGCRQEQVSRWAQMDSPPHHMRKGFDDSLAAALKIDRRMLFHDWKESKPADAPLVEPRPNKPTPWTREFPDDEEKREYLRHLLLHGEDLEMVYRIARTLTRSMMMEFDILATQIQREKGISRGEAEKLLPARFTGRSPQSDLVFEPEPRK